MDVRYDDLVRRGLMSPADQKAYEANRAEAVAALDEVRGTADVTYEQFREAFDQGVGCETLYHLRNNMNPKDPLKVAANEDLRSVGCVSPRETRR